MVKRDEWQEEMNGRMGTRAGSGARMRDARSKREKSNGGKEEWQKGGMEEEMYLGKCMESGMDEYRNR